MTIDEMKARLAELQKEAEELQAKIEAYDATETRSEDEETLEAIEEKLDEVIEAAEELVEAIDKSEERSAKIANIRTRAAQPNRQGAPMRVRSMPHTDPANKRHRYDVSRIIRSQLTGERLDGIEAECHQELMRERSADTRGILVPHDVMVRTRALDMTTGAGVVGQAIMTPLVDALRARLVLPQLGLRVISTSGKFKLPRVTTGNVYHVDGASPTASNRAPDAVAFDLHTIAGKTKIARKMLLASDIDVQAYVWDTLIGDIAGGIQVGCLTGTGADGQPKGLFSHTGSDGVTVKSLGTNGAAAKYGDLLSLVASVDTANAFASQGFLLSEKGAAKLEGTPKETGHPIYCLDPATGLCAGRKYLSTSAVPDNLSKGTGTNLSAAAFGAWEYAVLALFSGVDVFVNPYADDDGGVLISAFQDYDFGLTRPQAFAFVTDFNAA